MYKNTYNEGKYILIET